GNELEHLEHARAELHELGLGLVDALDRVAERAPAVARILVPLEVGGRGHESRLAVAARDDDEPFPELGGAEVDGVDEPPSGLVADLLEVLAHLVEQSVVDAALAAEQALHVFEDREAGAQLAHRPDVVEEEQAALVGHPAAVARGRERLARGSADHRERFALDARAATEIL